MTSIKHNSLRKLCSKVKWQPNNVLSGRFISYNINNKSHYHHSIKQTSHKNIKKYQLGDKLTQYQTLWTNIMRIVWQTVRRIPKKFWINNTILTMELRSFQYTACMWWIMVLSVFFFFCFCFFCFFFFCYLSMKSKNNLPLKFPLKIFFQIIIIWDKGWKREHFN